MTRTFLRPKTVGSMTGYCPVHVLRKARDPHDDFPSPIQIGPNAFAFDSEEVEAWMTRRIAERDGKAT